MLYHLRLTTRQELVTKLDAKRGGKKKKRFILKNLIQL